ncbi:MAG: Ig-like domain-containing protein [Myxococcales bacterium]|nr:Ig-like domain-containing protein [Myxococcales bacterium]
MVSTAPADGATEVAPDVVLTVTFSEPMAGLTSESFRLEGPSGAVAGAVSTSGAVARFTPAAPLEAGPHHATLTVAARDLAGNALATAHAFSFAVRAEVVDLTPPEVVSVTPLDAATDVHPDVVVRATFSEPLDCTTVAGAFTLAGEVAVDGTVACDGAVVSFTPAAPLYFLTYYEARLGTQITDLAGNALEAPYTWGFRVEAWVDTTPPEVVSTVPAPDAVDVAVGTPISVAFSEAIDPATVSAETIQVDDGAPVAGQLAVSDATVVFTPAAALQPGQTYTVTVGTGVQDLAGNALAEAVAWSFTTAAAPTGPSVLYERNGDIYRVREDGTGRVVIAGASGRNEHVLGISASGRIVYLREGDLYSVGPEGADPVQLESPWPSSLVFRGISSNDRVIYGMNGDLFAIDLDGTDKVTLASTEDDETDAVVGPGGRVVYRTIPFSGTDQKLMSVLDDGTGGVTLDAAPQMKSIAHIDAAGRVFFERMLGYYSSYQYDAFRVGVDGSGLLELAATTAYSEVFFAEASDGTVALSTCQLPLCETSLVVVAGVTLDCGRGGPRGLTSDDRFIVAQGPLGAQDLLAVNTAGGATPIAADPTANDLFLAVHPDGRVIYRAYGPSEQWDLYSVRSDGAGTVALADGPASETFWGVTPTGRVVWAIDPASTPGQLWSINGDGTDARLLRESAEVLVFGGFTKTGKVAYLEAGDLFLADHDGTSPVNLTQNPTSGTQSFVGSYP